MLEFGKFTGIYFYGGVVDFRRSIDGLSALVQAAITQDLYGTNLFLFVSRDKRKVKMLYWDETGFALWYKRLEKDRFPIERKRPDHVIVLKPEELRWFLSGIDLWRIKKHQPVQIQAA